jgi:glycosyltransferase involved in cell wall biosynthesis
VSDVVAFDLRAAGGSPTGVGRYMLGIVQALAEYAPEMRLRAYVRSEVAGLPPGTQVVAVRSRGPLWHARVWWDLRRRPVRAYCSTSLIIPALTGIPCLPVILDVISFLFPQYHKLRTRLAEKLLMGRAVRRWPLIAESATTLQDVQALFGPVRATVVAPWFGPARAPADRGPELLGGLGVEMPYALYIGTIEPRKNVLTPARAIAGLRRTGSRMRLVILGGRGWIGRAEMAELSALAADGTVVMTGYRSDEEREALLGSASCLVLPSVYEGFGIPLVEAMRHGVPCVCSTAPVFDEVAGDAAIHVETYDVEDWAAQLERVARDRKLRARLVEAGLERARKYSPESTARAFDEALAQLGCPAAPTRS